MAPAKVQDDPVTAEYDVLITPAMAEQMYLLQYPIRGREHPYNERNAAKPTEMRMKRRAGYMELDIEMSTSQNFNKYQGLIWGEAMRKAQAAGSTTFGAAAGFGPGKAAGGRGRRPEEEDFDEFSLGNELDNFPRAVHEERVFHKQTLGGQVLQSEAGKPNYMLGAFRGNELHLTALDGVIQMRPQFHHIDAAVHVEQGRTRREVDENKPPPQARGLVQSYKDNRDFEDSRTARDKSLMQLAQEEPWTRLQYHDEDEDMSYNVYHQRLFVSNTDEASKLTSSLSNEEYLDAVSAPRQDPGNRRRKKPLTRKQRTQIERGEEATEAQEAATEDAAEQ